jgi:cellulose synthase/poly-beta-1,6-N-acetylglucosamine synthase-like glycosyltransferase
MVIAHFLAWGAFAVLLYAYFGYPPLLALCALVRRPRERSPLNDTPHVTMVLAAWNEGRVIREKIENTLAQHYPADRLDLIVVSDGSTDATNRVVEDFATRTGRVYLLQTQGRQGKSLALNLGVPAARGEIVVLTDANAMFHPEAVAELVRGFSSPEVGAVSGQLRLRPREGMAEGESVYWRYEQRVKRAEAALDSLLGANGSIYAIRKELFRPLQARDVNDFRIPYEVLLQGYTVVLAPEAISYEEPAPSLWDEYRRKVRIMARAIPTMLALLGPTLRRGRLFLAWQLISHKLLREVQGIFFLAALAGALWGARLGSPLLAAFAAAQLLLYLLGAVAWAVPAVAGWRPGRLAAHFDMIVLASLAALWLWLTRRTKATWRPVRAAS